MRSPSREAGLAVHGGQSCGPLPDTLPDTSKPRKSAVLDSPDRYRAEFARFMCARTYSINFITTVR